MALPFISSERKKPQQLVAIDLGARTTKAVELQRKGNAYVLSGYSVTDAPQADSAVSAEALGQHLKNVCQSVGSKHRAVAVALSVSDALVRQADLPMMPVGDLRQVLKSSHKNYLQQDLPGHVFDCFITVPKAAPKTDDKTKTAVPNSLKGVLVAAAKKDLVDTLERAMKATGLSAEAIVPGLISPVNAFELAMPDIFINEAVALIDIGFKNTSICLLNQGELALSRVVNIGGDRLTTGLAESIGVSYAEAEGIKVGIASEVQPQLEALIYPLGRELRASIDCFEHQHDRPITKVFISGGSARSDLIVQTLQAELMVECKIWNPLSFLTLDLTPEKTAELEATAPQLAVAIGTAMAAL